MVVLNCFTDMSSSGKSTTSKANSLPAGGDNSEFSQEQWLDLLRALPPNSCVNLQLALKRFLYETHLSSAGSSQSLVTPQIQKKTLPDAYTLVPHNEIPQNPYVKYQYESLQRQSHDMERKSVVPSPNHALSSRPLDSLNGLDTLAAAALATTNSQTNSSPASAITMLHSKPVSESDLITLAATPLITPTMHSGPMSDQGQCQSPTIRETPKRLAVMKAAAAEQAAACAAAADVVGGALSSPIEDCGGLQYIGAGNHEHSRRIRLGHEKIDGLGSKPISSRLISNGELASSVKSVTAMKPDPEGTFDYHSSTDHHGSWVVHQPSGISIPSNNNKRRCRDVGVNADEMARREKRRERNRVAAAKCRQNRQNQIEDLTVRRKILEEEGVQTQQLIQNLLHEKAKIEELLKKHAHNGCPTAAQYYQNGSLLIPIPGSTSSASCTTANIRIIQPTGSIISSSMITTPSAGSTVNNTMSLHNTIKPESHGSGPFIFVPAQRPNTLSLITPPKLDTPTLDSATSLAAHLWSSSVAAKIQTPSGENWVNSQIGLPPAMADIKMEHDNKPSGHDILQQLGISLNSASTPPQLLQMSVRNTAGIEVIDPDIKVTSAS